MSSIYRVRRQEFPNRECRITMTQVRLPRAFPEESTADPSLDIGCEFAELPSRAASRTTKFGTFAKRAIQRRGGALDRVSESPSETLFLTGTLPGSTPQAMAVIASDAHRIVKCLNDWLKHYVDKPLRFYVWELQKRGALHLHYVIHVPHKLTHEWIKRNWHEKWCDLLDMVGKRHNVCLYQRGFGDRRVHPRSAVQTLALSCTKSVAAYLAKYTSKGSNNPNVRTAKYAPKRWWGCSRWLKALTDKLSTTVDIEFSSYQQAHTYFRISTEAITPAAKVQYVYEHKAGVGMTSVSYYLENIWKAMTQHQLTETTEYLSPLQKQLYRESLLVGRLSLLTTNFSRYSKSSGLRTTASFDSLLQCANRRMLIGADGDFGNIRAWVRDVLALSSSLTTGKLVRRLSHREVEEHSRMIRSLWRLEESKLYRGHKAWNCLNSCDNFLRSFDQMEPEWVVEELVPPNGVDPLISMPARIQLALPL